MKITVTGSLGNVSHILTRKLVADGHTVKLITSSTQRVASITQMGATALVGSIGDAEFIQSAFTGSDAVYLMIPPDPQATDVKKYIKKIGEQYAGAVKAAGIKYVVNLSSIGAELEDGPGPTGAHYFVESRLNELPETHVLHLRPGMFFTNFYGAIPMIKYRHCLGHNFAGSVQLPLTHPGDIAAVAFDALRSLTFSGKQVRYIISDLRDGFSVARELGRAAGVAGVDWIEFSDGEFLQALVESGFPEQIATVYMVEIGAAFREGRFPDDFYRQRSEWAGGTRLPDFAKEFAAAYQNSPQ